jgi:hypothetical protein
MITISLKIYPNSAPWLLEDIAIELAMIAFLSEYPLPSHEWINWEII